MDLHAEVQCEVCGLIYSANKSACPKPGCIGKRENALPVDKISGTADSWIKGHRNSPEKSFYEKLCK